MFTTEFSTDMFPRTNLNDLNLDWIVAKVKELEERVERLEDEANDNP